MAKIDWAGLLNPILSFFDKEFRSWTDKIANGVPANSILRKEAAERGFDILRGFLEKNVQLKGPSQALKEKVIDIGDYFASSLFRKEKADKKTAVKARDWMNRFLAYAEKRISEVKDLESLENELKRLEREFEIRKTIVEIVEAAAKAAEPAVEAEPEIEPADWKVRWGKMRQLFEKAKKRIQDLKLKENIEKADQKVASKIWQFHGWLEKKGVK